MRIDHEKLTYRYSGRDYRLTDVRSVGQNSLSSQLVRVDTHGERKSGLDFQKL